MSGIFTRVSPSAGALRTEALLRPGEALSGLGLWCCLEEGVHTVSLRVKGEAVSLGVIAPLGVRVSVATDKIFARRKQRDSWGGAGLRWEGGAMHAVPVPVRVQGSALSKVCVAELSGVAARESGAELTLELVVDGARVAAATIEVVVSTTVGRAEGWWCSRAEWSLDRVESAVKLARLGELVAKLFSDRGIFEAELLVARAHHGAHRESIRFSRDGVGGPAWRRALAWAARGELASLSIEDCDQRGVLRARWRRGDGDGEGVVCVTSVWGQVPVQGDLDGAVWMRGACPGWADGGGRTAGDSLTCETKLLGADVGVPPAREVL